MIEPSHLLTEVIKPVLQHLGLQGELAERLLLGTACVESECGRSLKQLGGPALGIYQMEPATHEDIWNHYLDYRQDLANKVKYWRVCYSNGKGAAELTGNLYYATAMARIHYLRVKDDIPDTLPGQAWYWKMHYNTENGRGTPEKYMSCWDQFVGRGTWV